MTISPANLSSTPRRRRRRSLAVGFLAILAAIELLAGVGQPVAVPAGESLGPGAGPASQGAGLAATPSASASLQPASTPGATDPPAPAPTPAVQAAIAQPAAVAPLILALLDARLVELRDLLGLPGVSATVIFRDGTTWTGVAGLADVGGGIAVRSDTSFAVASLTKTFTSALILQLVEEGRLTLDEPAAPHLAGIVIDRRITIRQLLDHTSGLRDFLLNPKIETAFAANPDARWSATRSLSFVGKPYSAPGAAFHYSNTNYLLLGLIAERVTGQTLALGLRERFFRPLGLRTTFSQGAEAPVTPLAHGYRFSTGSPTEPPIEIVSRTGIVPFSAVVTAAGGAGSVAAGSADLAIWARALYTGRVLNMATVVTMVDDIERPTAVDPALPYGLGVQAVRVDGRPTLGHSGRYLGARTVVRYFPLDGLTISVLTNQSRVDPSDVLVELLRIAVRA